MRGMRGYILAIVVATALAPARSSSSSPSPDTPEAAARREVLHQILDRAKTQGDGIHDACGELDYVGDASSIPHIIRVLRLFPDEEIDGTPSLGIVCTQKHCVDALEHLTGVNVGVTYSSWREWWERTHPDEPLTTSPDSGQNP